MRILLVLVCIMAMAIGWAGLEVVQATVSIEQNFGKHPNRSAVSIPKLPGATANTVKAAATKLVMPVVEGKIFDIFS